VVLREIAPVSTFIVVCCRQVPISAKFYEQLLHAQIPKAQKNSQVVSPFFVLSRSAHAKADSRMFGKLTPGANFSNVL